MQSILGMPSDELPPTEGRGRYIIILGGKDYGDNRSEQLQ